MNKKKIIIKPKPLIKARAFIMKDGISIPDTNDKATNEKVKLQNEKEIQS